MEGLFNMNYSIEALLLIENIITTKALAAFLSENYDYTVNFLSSPNDDYDITAIQVWQETKRFDSIIEKVFPPQKTPKQIFDIAIVDQKYWDTTSGNPSANNWITQLKEKNPEINFIFFISDETKMDLTARKIGANRYLGEDTKNNFQLIGQTVQLLSVENAIQRLAQDMASYSPDILTSICQHIVHIFDVDHSGIVEFDASYVKGRATAEYPPRTPDVAKQRPLGSELPVRNVPAELELVHRKKPMVFEDLEHNLTLGPVRDILIDAFNIRSTLIVPIIGRNNNVIASFSLDISKDNTKFESFSPEIIVMCQHLAKHIAVAVEHYFVQKALAKTAKIISAPIRNELPLGQRLHEIIEIVVNLLFATGGGLYLYDSNKEILTIVADYNRPHHIGRFLRHDEGMAGLLIKKGFEYLATPNYVKEPYYAVNQYDFGSVIEVPLEWQNRPIGVLYIDDEIGRIFTQREAQQLNLFANQIASLVEAFNQNRKLLVINNVIKRITNEFHTESILSVIVSEIADHLNSSHCTFFEEENLSGERFLVPKASCGRGHHRIMNRRFPLDGSVPSLVADVYSSGQPILSGNAKLEHNFAEARENEDKPRSMLLVPVRIGKQILGVITVDQDQLFAFNQYDLDLVDALAQQAAPVIIRSNTLRLLQQTGEQIISRAKVGETMRQIVIDAMKLCNASSGVIYRIKEVAGTYFITYKFPYPSEFHHPDPRLDNEVGVTRRVLATASAIVMSNILDNNQQINKKLYEKGVRSMIALPLKRGNDVIGVLFLNSNEPRKYTPVELFSLETLAGLAAIGIRNAELFEERESIREQVSNLYQASDVLTLSQDPNHILQTVARLACQAARAKSVRILLFDQVNSAFELKDVICYGVIPRNKRLEARKDGRSVEVMQSGKPVIIRNIEEAQNTPNWINPNMVNDGIRAALCLPLYHVGKPTRLGVMWIQYTEPHDFAEHEISALLLFASQAAYAYYNIKRLTELEEGLRGATESFADDIKEDYKQTRLQADKNYLTGRVFSILGMVIIFVGIVIEILFPIRSGIGSVILGLVSEGISLIFFSRIDKANDRMDVYHRELYDVRSFEQLVAAAKTLNNEEEKKKTLEAGRQHWLSNKSNSL